MTDGVQGELPLGPRLVAAQRPRERDLLFDAVVAACGIDPTELTAGARGALNRALRELREVRAQPEQVATRAFVFRAYWPSITLTPSALAKHWPQLGHPSVTHGLVSNRQSQITTAINRALGSVYRDTENVIVKGDLL